MCLHDLSLKHGPSLSPTTFFKMTNKFIRLVLNVIKLRFLSRNSKDGQQGYPAVFQVSRCHGFRASVFLMEVPVSLE